MRFDATGRFGSDPIDRSVEKSHGNRIKSFAISPIVRIAPRDLLRGFALIVMEPSRQTPQFHGWPAATKR